MRSLVSAAAAALTLFGANPALGHSGQREAAQMARQRMAMHERAIASGDPSRSPYYRLRGPAGQSGSRHGEELWYRELIAQS